MYKFPVIIFEGIEASGKSIHLKNVINYLKKINRKFVKIREPGGSKYSESIRRLILEGNEFIGHEFKGKYLDCGTMSGYLKSSNEMSKL